MVRAIGLDIVEIERIEKNLARFGVRFIKKILSESELAVFNRRRDKAAFLAGRFAAKEAVIKGLGTFIEDRPTLSSIQIIPNAQGAPEVVFPFSVLPHLSGIACIISITHERTTAAAVAVFSEVV